ncbi:MAG: excinuclease ABC subunit UvrC, partial [Actinomycetota bacterium]|nr:excinuclease ABC subunit UvrC [Actinomycetota bacterium]
NYFAADLHPRTKAMVEAAADVEWIVTESEVQALHLELNLIKQHRPRYNVRYRDDKTYPYLAITLDEEYPRARVLRERKRTGVRYYGPFAHAYAIRDTLDLLLRTFPMRTCSQGVFDRCRRRGKPCLLFHIERCAGPCVEAVSEAEHRQIALELCDFLDGNTKPVIHRLEAAMKDAATTEEFERAAKYRDQLDNVRKAIARQQMVSAHGENMDVISLAEDELEAAFQVFFVRGGRVTGRKGFVVDKVEDLSTAALVEGFLQRLYADGEAPPPQVLVPVAPEDPDLIGRWLTELRGSNVRVRVPQRGGKRRLLETVTENAKHAFAQHRLKRSSDFAARSLQLNELQEALEMDEAPLRIECFDISNTGPTDAVGSMVVFEDGLPKRSDYRRFAIKWGQGQDDFANMGEVIRRRFSRYLEESESGSRSRKFAYPPNLVVIDGGKGQLNRAVEVMEELGVEGITTISLAKRMEEVFVPGAAEPIRIPRSSEALYLLQRIRDEAHRFALTYHQLRRTKKMTQSALDGIPGLGEVRRKKLVKHFGSVKRVRQASLEELRAVPGLPDSVAEAVFETLRERRAS